MRLRVYPGFTFDEDTRADEGVLNAAANPSVEGVPGTVTGADLDLASVKLALEDSLVEANYFSTGNFPAEDRFWQAAGGYAHPAGQRTRNALGWTVLPDGAAVLSRRAERAPDTRSTFALEVEGAEGVAIVEVAGTLPANVASTLRATALVFSVWIHNDTGAALVPTLEVHGLAAGGAAASALAGTAVLPAPDAIPSGTWGRAQWTFGSAEVGDFKHGAEFRVGFASGALDSPSKLVRLAQAQLEAGTVAGEYRRRTEYETPVAVPYTTAPAGALPPFDALAVVQGGQVRSYEATDLPDNTALVVKGGKWVVSERGYQEIIEVTLGSTTAEIQVQPSGLTIDLSAVVPEGTTHVNVFALAQAISLESGQWMSTEILANGRSIASATCRDQVGLANSLSFNSNSAERRISLPANRILPVEVVMTWTGVTLGFYARYYVAVGGYYI